MHLTHSTRGQEKKKELINNLSQIQACMCVNMFQYFVKFLLAFSVYASQCCPNLRWATRLPLQVWSKPTAPQCRAPQQRSCGTWRGITAPWAPLWRHSSRRATGPPWSSARWLSNQGCWKTCPSNAWCTTKGSSHRLLYPWTRKVSGCQLTPLFFHIFHIF